jgi:hypothetical protein
MPLSLNLTIWGLQGLSNCGRRATGWCVRCCLPCCCPSCWVCSRNPAYRPRPLLNATSHGLFAILPEAGLANATSTTSGMMFSASFVRRDANSVPRSLRMNSHPSTFHGSLQGFLRGYP